MDKLGALVSRAELEGPMQWQAMEDIMLLSKVRANLPVLFRHVGLVPLAIQHSLAGSLPALYLLLSLASNSALKRRMYAFPDLIPTLVQRARWHHDNEDVQHTAILIMLLLLTKVANCVEFVRGGCALQMAELAESSARPKTRAFAFIALHACVGDNDHVEELVVAGGRDEEEEDEQDVVQQLQVTAWEEFFHHADGQLMMFLVRSPHLQYKLGVFIKLAECESIALDMLHFPGLLALLLETIGEESGETLANRTEATKTLRSLILHRPCDALNMAGVSECLVHTAATGESLSNLASSSLLRWHRALSAAGGGGGGGATDKKVSKREIISFWRSAPKLWALISTPRHKKKSPLRRLPAEMYRLLGLMMCGSNL